MQKRLLIVGAGGFGRETYYLAQDCQRASGEWYIGGFHDANVDALRGFDLPVGIVGDPRTYQPTPGDVYVCAIGDPGVKLRVGRELEARGANFVSLVHPTAIVRPACRIGRGVLISPYVIVSCNVTLGDFVAINLTSIIGHDAVIGAGSTLSSHCAVNGFAQLGEGAFLGSHAVVMPGAKVGDYGKVGAGSVVLHRLAAHTTAMGVPAKRLCSAEELQQPRHVA